MKTQFQKLTAFLLTVMLLISVIPMQVHGASDIWNGTVASSYAGGNGTSTNPYQIKTAEQLAYLAEQVNNGTAYESTYFALMSDIILNDTANWNEWETTSPLNIWTPIGNESYSEFPFSGYFDGNNHIISGLCINSTVIGYHRGLFGFCSGAEIKNVGIINSLIFGSSGTAGAVCGYCNENTSITNCFFTGKIHTSSYDVGGIVGNCNGNITNCYNSGSISSNSNGSLSCPTGGIVGSCFGTITNCYNSGRIESQCLSGYLGGIVGYMDGSISLSYNTGIINQDSGTVLGGVVGGIGGHVDSGIVENCYNTGSVTGPTVGGILGYGTALACYNIGTVTGTVKLGGIGGICGSSQGSVSYNCYSLDSCVSNPTNGKTHILNENQFHEKNSFEDYDFETVWSIDSTNETYSYPTLKGVTHSDNHLYVERIAPEYIISEATCKNKAIYCKSCAACGATSTETFEIGEPNPGNHDGDTYTVNQKNATRTEDGYTGDIYCTDCQTLIRSGKIIGKITFDDIKENDYFYNAVLWAAAEGVTSGTDATHFSPNLSCTRSQMVTFLWRTAGSPEPISTDCKFTDVASNAYYYKAILWAVEKGITTGTSITAFSPDADCSRGQTVTFLYRFANSPAVSAVNTFNDVNSNDYFYNAVLWASQNGVTTGTGDGMFSPNAVCTRAQIVTFLYRAIIK